MSERLLCGDPSFFVNVVVDDQTPLHCTAIHFFNSGTAQAVFTCVVAGSNIAIAFDADTDQVWNLPSPIVVQTGTGIRGTGWSIPGLTNYAIRTNPSIPTGSLPTDIPGQNIYANISTGVAQNSQGHPVSIPGTITHNAAPV
jgi:hypothetical protein